MHTCKLLYCCTLLSALAGDMSPELALTPVVKSVHNTSKLYPVKTQANTPALYHFSSQAAGSWHKDSNARVPLPAVPDFQVCISQVTASMQLKILCAMLLDVFDGASTHLLRFQNLQHSNLTNVCHGVGRSDSSQEAQQLMRTSWKPGGASTTRYLFSQSPYHMAETFRLVDDCKHALVIYTQLQRQASPALLMIERQLHIIAHMPQHLSMAMLHLLHVGKGPRLTDTRTVQWQSVPTISVRGFS